VSSFDYRWVLLRELFMPRKRKKSLGAVPGKQGLRVLGCNKSLNLHFLHSHLYYFPDNLGAFSEEQGGRFHQDFKELGSRYQGHWDVHMMADCCWSIERKGTSKEHSWPATTRKFTGKRKHGCSAQHPNC
jgi:hypothetical protein